MLPIAPHKRTSARKRVIQYVEGTMKENDYSFGEICKAIASLGMIIFVIAQIIWFLNT